MNPFTRFLRQWNKDKDLDRLIEHCDALEALVIRVYKGGEATPADEAEYQALRSWLQANYHEWQDDLEPFWRRAKVAGAAPARDPFLRLIETESASEFVGDWEAMQNLPAVREALNSMVLSKDENETS